MEKVQKQDSQGRAPRKDLFFLELDQLATIDGFNVRQDYGDLEELANSIEQNGVRVPIRGYKKGGINIITDGHRRFKACQLLKERGVDVRVPFLADGRESNEETRVLDMLICNEGKKLNPVEQSEAIKRLVNYGYSEDEIAKKTGFSKTYIANLILLNSAPKKFKDLIASDVVRSTQAMKIWREAKDFDEAIKIIEGAVSYSEQNNSKKKVTDSVVNKSLGKVNSFAAVKKAIRVAEKRTIKPENVELFNLLKKINDGEFTLEFLLSELYEPLPEKKSKKEKEEQPEVA